MNSESFNSDDLVLVRKANPENLKYIREGATVWLNSGSPPLKVVGVKGNIVEVTHRNITLHLSRECLTPEPTPISS